MTMSGALGDKNAANADEVSADDGRGDRMTSAPSMDRPTRSMPRC